MMGIYPTRGHVTGTARGRLLECVCGRKYREPDEPCHTECGICGAVTDEEYCEECEAVIDEATDSVRS